MLRCISIPLHCSTTPLINDSVSKITFLIWQKFGFFALFLDQKPHWLHQNTLMLLSLNHNIYDGVYKYWFKLIFGGARYSSKMANFFHIMNEILDTLSFIKGVTSQWYYHLYSWLSHIIVTSSKRSICIHLFSCSELKIPCSDFDCTID